MTLLIPKQQVARWCMKHEWLTITSELIYIYPRDIKPWQVFSAVMVWPTQKLSQFWFGVHEKAPFLVQFFARPL